jgi:hypothetical protein
MFSLQGGVPKSTLWQDFLLSIHLNIQSLNGWYCVTGVEGKIYWWRSTELDVAMPCKC